VPLSDIAIASRTLCGTERMRKLVVRVWTLLVLLLSLGWQCACASEPTLLARAGTGALYELDGQRVAILAGSPSEMGRQHGALLGEDVRAMVGLVLSYARAALGVRGRGSFHGTLADAYERCVRFIPDRYLREMDALADAAGVPRRDVRLVNIFPELFHCSGFALMGRATAGGQLLHGRVLDYMTGVGLQRHAVTFICIPDGHNAFVNVGFAGFIGSVTGMNDEQVAVGEMGGGGEGLWDGMPMGFLMREALEQARTLDEALRIFEQTPRTCEYYYVISDGKSRQAVGLHCTPEKLVSVLPGQSHPQLPTPIADTVLLSAGGRYRELVQRVKEGYGRIDPKAALELMKRPVAMRSNLHCVLFAPESLTLWVAVAGDPTTQERFQACDQPYVRIQMSEWLNRASALAQAAKAHGAPQKTSVPDAPLKLGGIGDDEARPPIASAGCPELETLLEQYRLPGKKFAWSARLAGRTRNYAIYLLRFPSAVQTPYPEDNTVWCEYYRVHGMKPRPAVIVLHALGCKFAVARLICSTLADSGVDAVMLKLPFYGEREQANTSGRFTIAELFRLFFVQGVADVRRAAALLSGLTEVPDGQVGICGVSLGGLVGALACGVDGNFKRTALALAGGDLYEIVTSGSRFTVGIEEQFAEAGLAGQELAEFLKPLDPLTFAARLKSCEVLMMNVTGDEVVPAETARALARAAGEKKIVWYKGNQHISMAWYLFDALNRVRSHFEPGKW